MNQRNNTIARCAVITALVTSVTALFTSIAAGADISDDLHKRLEQRWYITEVIAFHDESTLSNSYEQLMLTEIERDTELVLDPEDEEEVGDAEGAVSLSGAPPLKPPPTEDDLRQQAFNAENPYPAGSRDSVRRGENASDIEFNTIGSDVGYAVVSPENQIEDVITTNLNSFEEMLRALDRRWLNQNYLSMADQATRVNRGRGRKLLFHGAWLQAVPERSAPNPVSVNALPGRSASAADSGASPELDGEIAVTVGKYLHVNANLAYYPDGKDSGGFGEPSTDKPATLFGRRFGSRARDSAPDPASTDAQPTREQNGSGRFTQQPPSAPSVQGFGTSVADDSQYFVAPHLRLQQTRRMRSNKVHYIDHPGLGLLVKITQVPFPELLQQQLRIAKEGQ